MYILLFLLYPRNITFIARLSILNFLFSRVSSAQQFVEPLINSSGIYFDPLGPLNIITNYLSVVIPVDISYIQPHVTDLAYSINSSKSLCEESNTMSQVECDNLFLPLITRYKELSRDNEALINLTPRHSKREAILGFIGTLSKKLFGTMDENDAIRYDHAIKEIQSDEKKLASLIKENILVTSTTLKTFNQSIHNLDSNQRKLSVAIDALYVEVRNLSTISRELATRSRILEIVSIIENYLLTLSFKTEDIINSIMFSKSNTLYSTILTPKELYGELVNNYRFIPNSRRLPILLSPNNIHIILNISSVSCYMNKNEVVFVLDIPLIHPTDFYLYHNLPCPVPHEVGNPISYSTIIPSSKYIGISSDKTSYIKIDDLQSCKIISSNTYLCDTSVIYSSAATPICEIEIMTKPITSIPETCATKFFHGYIHIWQHLQNNKWLFVMSERSKLNIEYNVTELVELVISGSGVLYLPPGSVAYCRDTKLMSKNKINIVIKPVKTYLSILNDSCCNKLSFKNIASLLPPVNLKNIDLDSIAFDNVNALKDLDRIIEKPNIVLYESYYNIIIVFIVLVIISFTIFKLCKITGVYKRIHFSKSSTTPQSTNDEIEITDIPAPQLRIR